MHQEALHAAGLKSIGIVPTHFPENARPSLLNLFLTNRPEKVIAFNQISHGMSKHDIIFGSYSCNVRNNADRTRLSRNLYKVNIDSLYADVDTVDWNPVFRATNIDDKVVNFNAAMQLLLNRHAPLRLVKKRACLTFIKP